MNVQTATSIFMIARLEKSKDAGMEAFCKALTCELPGLVAPAALERYEPSKSVYHVKENTVPVKTNHIIVYPENFNDYNGCAECEPERTTSMLDKETNYEWFGALNFANPHYHLIKAYLFVRESLYKFIRERVDISRHAQGKYIIKHNGEELTADELEAEIKLFEQAVMIRVEEAMHKRYNFESKPVRNYCYAKFSAEDAEMNPVLVDTLLKAISVPREVYDLIEKKDFSLLTYKSKICPNLQFEVMLFLDNAYKLIYHEI